jgi:zinc D-Ala-D-Ala carboxypeptidase
VALTGGMAYRRPPARRRAGSIILAALVVVSAALIGLLGRQSSASSSSAASSTAAETFPRPPPVGPEADDHGGVGEADGAVPEGVTVFDDGYPAVGKLDPALLWALRQAATVATHDGVQIYVDSGWRSPKYQEQLLREAISKYGSEREAARWVATPDRSAHVSGEAVDLGPTKATAWLSRHGADYGLCQIYGNEPWHYELRPQAVDHGCPRMYADPTHDPRMQQ